jgi:hypothetical protein
MIILYANRYGMRHKRSDTNMSCFSVVRQGGRTKQVANEMNIELLE